MSSSSETYKVRNERETEMTNFEANPIENLNALRVEFQNRLNSNEPYANDGALKRFCESIPAYYQDDVATFRQNALHAHIVIQSAIPASDKAKLLHAFLCALTH